MAQIYMTLPSVALMKYFTNCHYPSQYDTQVTFHTPFWGVMETKIEITPWKNIIPVVLDKEYNTWPYTLLLHRSFIPPTVN